MPAETTFLSSGRGHTPSPFPPGCPGLVNKVLQGGRVAGFWVCHLQTRVAHAQLESCIDLAYILFLAPLHTSYLSYLWSSSNVNCPIWKTLGQGGYLKPILISRVLPHWTVLPMPLTHSIIQHVYPYTAKHMLKTCLPTASMDISNIFNAIRGTWSKETDKAYGLYYHR